MRKVFVTMVLAMAVAAVAHGATIALVPSALTVSVGSTFTVDVVVTGTASDAAEVLNVEVSFDPSLVAALGASEGEYMQQQSGEIPFAFGNLLDNTNGFLSYTITRFGPKTSTGSGTAATLTFECLAGGLTTLDYFAAISDQGGSTITSSTDSVSVQQGSGVVPEPMTLALVGAALTALGVVARKRS
jgi:hypothetical protein